MECQFLLQGDPKDQTQVACISCIDKRYFTTSAAWEAPRIWDPRALTMSVLAFRDGEGQRWLHHGGFLEEADLRMLGWGGGGELGRRAFWVDAELEQKPGEDRDAGQ